jgi:hypothetical protein
MKYFYYYIIIIIIIISYIFFIKRDFNINKKENFDNLRSNMFSRYQRYRRRFRLKQATVVDDFFYYIKHKMRVLSL